MAAARQDKAGKVPTGAVLTKFLRNLAAEIHTTADNGDPVTKAHALALVLWDRALGYEEQDPKNHNEKVRHNPEAWAIQLIYERLEGRSPVAIADTKGSTVAQKVSELGKSKINALVIPPAPPEIK
jgi:hypothetical protein